MVQGAREHFDIVVLGAGPGGGAAAAALAKAKKSVALIEDYGFGGTCPLRGCNPKKAVLGPAEAAHLALGLRDKGVLAPPNLSFPDLARFRDTFVAGKAESIRKAYASLGIETIQGRAVFTDPDSVTMVSGEDEGRTFGFGHAVVAVGQRPRRLDVPGEELIASSDDFLALAKMPERVVFIGGGYISFEFACVAQAAGAMTAIVHRSARPLRGFDPDMAMVATAGMRAAGVEIMLDAPLRSVSRENGEFVVRTGASGEKVLRCDLVVHGAGRVAAVQGLGLDRAGVEADEKGVRVTPHMRSVSNPRVFAVGDCTTLPFALTPTADMEGRIAAHNILHGDEKTMDAHGVPRVCFCLPPVCAVGALEEELVARGVDFEKKETDLAASFSWKRLGQEHAAAKVLAEPGGGLILGAHVAGHGADEIANILALAVRQGIPARELRVMPFAYPTLGYYIRSMV